MKNILLLAAAIVLSFTTLQAQNKETKINRLYVFGGGGPAFFSGSAGTLGLSAVVKKKWIASVGYMSANRKASAPSDMNVYTDELATFIANFFTAGLAGTSDTHPTAETKFTYVSFGRYYPTGRRVSFILDAGVGLAKGQDFNYYQGIVSGKPGEEILYRVSSNYTVTKSESTAVGFMARAGMDWAFSGGAGMGFDFFYNLCTGGISDNVGINFRLNIGYMPRNGKNALK